MLLFDTPLIIKRSRESGTKALHPPLVRARVGDHSTLLVVDTGTTETILTRSLANRLGLHLHDAEPGTDHANGSVPTWTARESIRLDIASYHMLLKDGSIVDAPASFESLGIGGVLCPQRMHDNAVVIMDFVHWRFQLISGGLATVPCAPDLHSSTFDLIALSGDESSLMVVEGTFPPSTSIKLMLNTGGYETELAPWLLPQTTSASRIRGRGLGGLPVHGVVLRERELMLQNVRVPLPEVIVRSQRDQIDGQLGMQILQGTHLAFHLREHSLRWAVPEQWLATR